MTCQTSVPNDGPIKFRPCGKPTTQSVVVGTRLRHYCAEHAEQAREFVARMGQGTIKAIQQHQPKGLS